MQEVLKITPTDLEKTVIDTANSMIELGVIKKSKKSKPKSESGAETEGRMSPCLLSSHLFFQSSRLIRTLKCNSPTFPPTFPSNLFPLTNSFLIVLSCSCENEW